MDTGLTTPLQSRPAAFSRRAIVALLVLLGCGLLAPAAHAATFQRQFDHLTTGFELLGQHRDLPCESCHANAIFKGTPKDCAGCHGVGTTVRATAKTTTHLMTTNLCESCHTVIAWKPAFIFDHTQAIGACSSCHNGVQAQGKTPNHIVTDLECDACHTTLTWAGAMFTHLGVTGGCAACHNNVSAQGMPTTHMPIGTGTTATPCEACHSPTNFINWLGGKINHAAVTQMTCGLSSGCHETANFLGMHPSTNTTAGDSRPNATLDANHAKGLLATADCGVCHATVTFAGAAVEPPKHIPTGTAPCLQCHTTPANNAIYSVTGVHQGVTSCLSCHAPAVANTFINVTIVTTPSNHIPIGSLDCNGSGCHSTANVNPGGFKIGAANVNTPTLTVAGHTTVAGAGGVSGCQSCHETSPYMGMIVGSASAWGDSRPTSYDKYHPTSGDCSGCHSTAPTFNGNQTAGATKPTGHIPTTAACGQCHTTSGNNALYSSTGVHQGVASCLACHGPGTGPFVGPPPSNTITVVGLPSNHIPIGSLDCNGSGCHTTANVTPGGGGFKIGAASVNTPTLTVAGHTTVATATPACATCHEQGVTFMGMIVTSASAWGDDRPMLYDKYHPVASAGDCSVCHSTVPTFALNMTGGAKPSNHIPTTAACAVCHTTLNNYALYSSPAVHQGVTGCLACHGPGVGTFAGPPPSNTITIVGWPASGHIQIGTADCNGSGCHTTANVTPGGGGFKIGSANINAPTLNVAGHSTISGAGVPLCATCHEAGTSFTGMMASNASTVGDTRPPTNASYDSVHPTSGDCGECHVTTPTFLTNELCGTKSLPACSAALPANHIPTSAVCGQCHTTAGNFAVYSVTGVHQGLPPNTCNQCHGASAGTLGSRTFLGPPPAGTITIVGVASGHIPTGAAPGIDCGSSGCHTTANVNPGGFKIGSANINAPTLNGAGHTTVQPVGACTTCHEAGVSFLGMVQSSNTTAGDTRPNATLDKIHPTTGDCATCHTTTPVFANDQTGNAKPSNHIPTTAACAVCHTTAGQFQLYSVTATHQGVTTCTNCHGSTVNTTFANVVPVTTPSNHIPTGSLDCNGSGCHTTANVNPGGFKIGAASVSAPTLTVAGHTTVKTAVPLCGSCHEQGVTFMGMIVTTSGAWGDDRPMLYDKAHPAKTAGDCSVCHTTTPTFNTNQTQGAKPSNHIPTTVTTCATCHTTPGNYAAYSVTATHSGVTTCKNCHGSTVNTTFAGTTPIVTTPSNHIPISTLDCNGSGCHTTANVNPGGFKIGTASLTAPTLTVAGHTTIKAAVATCTTCHEQGVTFMGMMVGTSGAWGDDRPMLYDKAHPAASSGDCSGCHTTTPTFATNQSGSAAKPANHIPTTAACGQCHTTAGNYTLYVMGATGHKGITTNCAQCHAYGLSFYNMAPPTLKQPPSGATGHIPSNPPNGTMVIACELCHSPTVFTAFSGTVMKHAYTTSIECDACHEKGLTWKTNGNLWTRPGNHHVGVNCNGAPAGSTTGSGGCHSTRDKSVIRMPTTPRVSPTTTTTTTTKPSSTGTTTTAAPRVGKVFPGDAASRAASAPTAASSAAPSTVGDVLARANTTLTTGATPPTAPFSHTTVTGTACVTCHAAANGTGKPASHIATSNNCQSCHTTLAWLPVTRVDHTQVIGKCASCHNGQIATGKSSSHIPTSAACDTCHTSIAWTPARFDHAAVTPHTCTTCHNSVVAIGMPRAHIPTTQQCDACHGTLRWSPVKIDHSHLTASCVSCHNNAGAIGLSPGHLRTQLDCARCHSYPDWSVINFRHISVAYPGTHHAALVCTSCHTSNTDQVPYPSAADAGTCAGCHAKDFKPAAHPKTTKGTPYTAHELANCSGACHVYSDTTQSTITRNLPGPHHRVSDATFKR